MTKAASTWEMRRRKQLLVSAWRGPLSGDSQGLWVMSLLPMMCVNSPTVISLACCLSRFATLSPSLCYVLIDTFSTLSRVRVARCRLLLCLVMLSPTTSEELLHHVVTQVVTSSATGRMSGKGTSTKSSAVHLTSFLMQACSALPYYMLLFSKVRKAI